MSTTISPEIIFQLADNGHRTEVVYRNLPDIPKAERIGQMIFRSTVESQDAWHESLPDDPMATPSLVVARNPDAAHGHDPFRFTMRLGNRPGLLKIIPSLDYDPELKERVVDNFREVFEGVTVSIPESA